MRTTKIIFLGLLLIFIYTRSSAQFEGPVIRSVEEANKNPLDVIVLDLSDQRFDELPEEVFNYKNLQRLRLNRTFIKELPSKIAMLTELKALELNHPKEPNADFKQLPKELATLKNLNYIGLIGLPNLDWVDAMKILKELPQLDNLALMHNGFETLPEGIEKIESLRKIWLGGNINLDPTEVFEKLPFLEQVGFGGSQYKELPNNMSNAPAISNLWLANNQLTSVGALAKLKHLNSLTLNGNMLTTLPYEIKQLSSLEMLSLDNNPDLDFDSVPNILSQLPTLKQLSLSNNALSKLPINFSQLSNLEVLILRGNNFSDDEKKRILSQLLNVKVIF